MIYTYLKQGLNTKVISKSYDITTLGGYENSVGATWQDYLSGKYILLNSEQLAFYQEHPDATPEEIYNAQLTPVPARTLDDAKKELHIKADDMAEELKVFYVDNMATWFSDRPSVNLQIDAEAFEGIEYIDLYDDNDNHIHLPLAEAKNMILAVERYDNRCKVFIRNLHSMIETIPTLEVADSIDVEEYRAQAPETPSFYTEPQPTAETYSVTFKLMDATTDNEATEVNAGDSWAATITPNKGYAILRTDFTAEMDAVPIDIQFGDDALMRPEYASFAYVSVKSVTGNLWVVTTALPIEPQPITADTYYVNYKLSNAHIDNDISAITAGERWKTSVYPDDGFAILRTDFTAEMGGKPIDVYFEPDKGGREEFASYAQMEIENVTGDIFIATTARN